jgi:hypothetical protein
MEKSAAILLTHAAFKVYGGGFVERIRQAKGNREASIPMSLCFAANELNVPNRKLSPIRLNIHSFVGRSAPVGCKVCAVKGRVASRYDADSISAVVVKVPTDHGQVETRIGRVNPQPISPSVVAPWIFNVHIRDTSLNVNAMPELTPLSILTFFLSAKTSISLNVGIEKRDITNLEEIDSRVVSIVL